MAPYSTVLLTAKGETRKANLSLQNDNLSIEVIQKYFKKKEVPERVCYYEYDTKFIFIFGYKTGKKDKESKVVLPIPYNTITLYGDVLVIVSLSHKWENPISYTIEQWASFCNSLNDIQQTKNEESDNDSDDESTDEDDILSTVGSEKSVKDDYAEDSDSDISLDESEDEKEDEAEELEAEPIVVKKKRATVLNPKIDANNFKDDVQKDSEPETSVLRTLSLNSLQFLKEQFSEESIRKLERKIFETTLDNSMRHYIPKNWKCPQFTELYRQILRSVLSNIHPNSPVKNPRLLSRVLEGEFELEEIATMTSYEMYPEKWFALRDKQLQREQKILEGNKSRATDQFKCRRCNKRECTYYELQTRSADEPMTIFITCLNCGKEWRQGG